jgi:hypothetical protein
MVRNECVWSVWSLSDLDRRRLIQISETAHPPAKYLHI